MEDAAAMREIKFRAWDKKFKQWAHISIDGGSMMPIGLNQAIASAQEDCELCQYTGLKDAQGVEIYEGDILQGRWGEREKEQKQEIIGPVSFQNGCFAWRTWLKHFTDFDGKSGIRWREDFDGFSEFREMVNIRVIGNIYENPELRKK